MKAIVTNQLTPIELVENNTIHSIAAKLKLFKSNISLMEPSRNLNVYVNSHYDVKKNNYFMSLDNSNRFSCKGGTYYNKYTI